MTKGKADDVFSVASGNLSPSALLFPYQRLILQSPARFKILNCSRQAGKSTVFAFEAVMKCVLTPNSRWVALSRGERQVKEWILKADYWAKIWCDYYCAIKQDDNAVSYHKTASEVVFSNGSRITGIPANPDTARGYSANVILDEFAYHENADDIWAAIFPAISNELNANFVLRVGSTVAGRNNKFWKLFAERNSIFKKYRITIHKAVEDGLPMNIPDLKKAIGDPDIWAQEYECIPVEGTTTLISYELIHAAQKQEATRECAYSILSEAGREFFVGIDIGRKHDLTAIWILELKGFDLITRCIKILRHADFETQQEEILSILKHRGVKICCVDATGIGAQLAETAAKRFPSKVIQCAFSAPFKTEIYLGMLKDFQEGAIQIPPEDEKEVVSIEEDIHNIQRVFTSGGNLLFYAPTNEDGHSDLGSALALALHAVRTRRNHSLGISATPRAQDTFSDSSFSFNGLSVPSIGKPRVI